MIDSAVLWDLNGVIIDDMQVHLMSFKEVLKEFGSDMSEEYMVERCVGTPPSEVFADLLPEIGNPITIEEAVERKRRSYFDLINGKMEMLPGVRSLIDGLYDLGIRQAIASGASVIEVKAILKEFGISDRFGAVVACEDVSRGKPDPEPFLTAASRLGIDPANCLVIEDGEYGTRAAKTCGMRVVAVTNTQTRDDLAAADVIVDSLEEICASTVLDLCQGRECPSTEHRGVSPIAPIV
ncbi:MAG: HAD family hydrolase [Armatimonadota bacterium]